MIWNMVRMGEAPAVVIDADQHRLIGDDRIEIVWSTGFTGVEAELSRVSADTLRGEGVTFTDVYPSTNHRATLTAVRVRCDAVIPAERRVSREDAGCRHHVQRAELERKRTSMMSALVELNRWK